MKEQNDMPVLCPIDGSTENRCVTPRYCRAQGKCRQAAEQKTDPRWGKEEEFVRSADGSETVAVDREAVIRNLIRENNSKQAEIDLLRAALSESRVLTANPVRAEAFDREAFRLAEKNNRLQRIEDRNSWWRALVVLHRMATERTGWRAIFQRWYFSDEPLRNDAANIVREARFEMPMPIGTRLVGERRQSDG